MSNSVRAVLGFGIFACLIIVVGSLQSWNLALSIFNLCLISAVMALGVNIQWGYAGLFNVGIMGFAALGGVAAMLTAQPVVASAWSAGGTGIAASAAILLIIIALVTVIYRKLASSRTRTLAITLTILVGYVVLRLVYDDAVSAIEADNPAKSGYLGGIGAPIIFSWIVGGLFAAGVAWVIGKIALGLRSDYLAIATLGISEILIAIIKNEEWLTRGVKNVTGLPRPVPYEIDLQQSETFREWVAWLFSDRLAALSQTERMEALEAFVVEYSSIFVKLCYSALFLGVLLIVLMLCVLALASPWGRMVRAIRDNEVSAAAMGKDVSRRHLQIFILGSAVVGIAGAMLTTIDGQLTPSSYQPLRYTFLIWVMVIVGGSGNNLGSVLGAFLIWYIWIQAAPAGNWLMEQATAWMDDSSALRQHLLDSAQYMRVVIMGAVMLLVMRFSPGGLIPERTAQAR